MQAKPDAPPPNGGSPEINLSGEHRLSVCLSERMQMRVIRNPVAVNLLLAVRFGEGCDIFADKF